MSGRNPTILIIKVVSKFNEQSWSSVILHLKQSDCAGGLSIKMSSYQYRDPHVKDKTVMRCGFWLTGGSSGSQSEVAFENKNIGILDEKTIQNGILSTG